MTAHAGTHKRGGNDPIRLDDLAEPQDNVDLDANTLRHGLLPKLSGDSSDVLLGDGTFAPPSGGTPSAHATTHQNGGSDEINVGGLSGLLADGQTPLAHATSHQAGGSDSIKLDDLAAPDDNTDLDASTGAHGLLKKLPGGTTTYLRADGTFATPGGTSGSADHAYFTYLAASLEPMATEKLQYGSFSYAITTPTKLLISAWACRIGSTGRIDVRDVSRFLPIRNQTIVGPTAGSMTAGSELPGSTACFVDPSLATYTDARTTYYDRLNTLMTSDLKYLALVAPSTFHLLLPGPYGIILVHTTTFDYTWIGPCSFVGSTGLGINALPITNEEGDTGSSQAQRVTTNHPIVMSKNWMMGILTGQERSAGVGFGSVLYYICTSSWGLVTDATSYIFRDDFMAATLDTATKWTRTQSTAGNIEINTNFQWCKALGNGSWSANGAISQTSTSRVTGKIFQCDVWIGTGGTPNIVVGWHDGAGLADTDFSHGLHFSVNGSAVKKIYIRENAAGAQETTKYTLGNMYRVRITLNGNAATYEIQGGPEYAVIGGSTWSTLTPGGGSSSSTTPLYAGFTIKEAVTCYVGDVKVY